MSNLAYTCSARGCLNTTQGRYCKEHIRADTSAKVRIPELQCTHLWHIQLPAPHLLKNCPDCGETHD